MNSTCSQYHILNSNSNFLYTNDEYNNLLVSHRIQHSNGDKDSPHDNNSFESFYTTITVLGIKTLKLNYLVT